MTTARQFKQRIASTNSLKKIFGAQELIAASRIAKARRFALEAKPYAKSVSNALASVIQHSDAEHRLLTPRESIKRAAVLVIAADRGMAGAYTASVMRSSGELVTKLENSGIEVDIYACGRRAANYFKFRDIPVLEHWSGESEAPSAKTVSEISEQLVNSYENEDETKRVDEVYIIYTSFVNMVSQNVKTLRMLPIEVVSEESTSVHPLYSFEPNAKAVLDQLLPRYIASRIHQCLLDSAASETASRQRAMHTATENANDLIKILTVKSNQARQTKITSELIEIVGSADALSKK